MKIDKHFTIVILAWIIRVIAILAFITSGLNHLSQASNFLVGVGTLELIIALLWILNLIKNHTDMFKKFFSIFVITVIACGSLTSCVERIDAGHEGIKVDLAGSDKGVNDVSLVTGYVFYNPMFSRIYEYPTFVQTIDYPAFTVNAKDGSEFTVDPTVSLKVTDSKAPFVFRKYRKELSDVINGPLFNYVRDAFRIQLNKFTTDGIVSNRDAIEKAVEKQLNAVLSKEGFQLEQLTSGLKYPQTIVDAVNAKNKAIQDAQRALNEVEVKKAEAEKMIVQARAEKEANELRQQALTPAILKKMWIEKWNGTTPVVVTNGNGMMLNMSDLTK